MKIGIDARFWNETGVGRYIRNLVDQLSEIDTTNSYVLFMKNADKALFKPKNDRWKTVGTDIHWHSLSEQLHFSKELEKENLDLMHFPYFSIPIRYNKPYVVTIHDLILHHFSTGEATTLPFPLYHLKKVGYKYIMNRAAHNAKKIITVSQATSSEVVDHLDADRSKISVIYEGVDARISNDKFQMTNFKYDKYFLHVGNVYPHKNAKRLVEAFAKADLEGCTLLFVGKKDYFMQQLEKLVVSLGLEKKILFLGFVSDEELGSLYGHAMATVVPSLMEGFGLPVLEAMANNSLVLAADIPSLKEIARDGVLYFDPFDVGDLSAKIRSIAQQDKPEIALLKERGLKLAKEYSWEKMARETLRVYESCISI